jgi:hypothetical protein
MRSGATMASARRRLRDPRGIRSSSSTTLRRSASPRYQRGARVLKIVDVDEMVQLLEPGVKLTLISLRLERSAVVR